MGAMVKMMLDVFTEPPFCPASDPKGTAEFYSR